MSGAVAAHASYNGSGTQGLAVTNKINDSSSGDVVSVFWNDNDTSRQLLYGASTMEVPTSGSGKNASWGGSQIFTVNNDVDCVGDMYLAVTIELDKPTVGVPTVCKTMIKDTELGLWGRLPPLLAANAVTADSLISMAGFASTTTSDEDKGYIPAISISDGADKFFYGKDLTAAADVVGNNVTAIHNGHHALHFYYKPMSGNNAWALIGGGGPNSELSAEGRLQQGTTTMDPTDFPGGINDITISGIKRLVDHYNAGVAPGVLAINGGPYASITGQSAADNPPHATAQALSEQLEVTENWVRPAGGPKITLVEACELVSRAQIAKTHYEATQLTQAGGGTANVGPFNTVPQDYLNLPVRMNDVSKYRTLDAAQRPAGVSYISDVANDKDLRIPWTSVFESVPSHIDHPGGLKGALSSGGTLGLQPTGKWAGSNLKTHGRFPLANILKRIEFQVGTQIWQTLEYNDLLSINATEIAESSYDRLGLQTSGYVRSDGQRESMGEPSWTPGTKYQAFIPLPMLTKSIGPQLENFTQQSEDGYLMAAAPHQNVKIKCHYNKFDDVFDTKSEGANPIAAKQVFSSNLSTVSGDFVSNVPVLWTPTATLSTKLYAQHMIMCNEEREQMKNMANGIPKRLKMTQNVNMQMPKLYPGQAVTVDLDHFSIYGSHLVISVTLPAMMVDLGVAPVLKYAELKLNSSSFSGQLDGALLQGITNKSLGLYANDFTLDKEKLDSGMGYYVFPLASRAFGGSSIPLNRFDNIRLLLTFESSLITSQGFDFSSGGVANINVTGVGETTGLYKAGAASLAMY